MHFANSIVNLPQHERASVQRKQVFMKKIKEKILARDKNAKYHKSKQISLALFKILFSDFQTFFACGKSKIFTRHSQSYIFVPAAFVKIF